MTEQQAAGALTETPPLPRIETDALYAEFVKSGGYAKDKEIDQLLREKYIPVMAKTEEGLQLLSERVAAFETFKQKKTKELKLEASILRKLINSQDYMELATDEVAVAKMAGLPFDAASILDSIKTNKKKEYNAIYKKIKEGISDDPDQDNAV